MRADISYVVNKVIQFMRAPVVKHWSAMKRILCYLKASPNHGLFFPSHGIHSLQGFYDSD